MDSKRHQSPIPKAESGPPEHGMLGPEGLSFHVKEYQAFSAINTDTRQVELSQNYGKQNKLHITRLR